MKRLTKSAKWTSIFMSMLILMLAQLTPLQAMELRSSNNTDLTSSSAQCSDGYQNSTDEYSGEGYQFDSSGFCYREHFKPGDNVCVERFFSWNIDDNNVCTLTLAQLIRTFDSSEKQCQLLDTCPDQCAAS